MVKILLTGSSGFIGQSLLTSLNKHYKIVCLQSDLLNFEQVQQEVFAVNPDLVVHLAAKTEVEHSFYNQIEFAQVNYVGTVNLVESILKCNKQVKFIFASTMEVFGWQPISDLIRQGNTPSVLPVFDSNTTPNPNAPYAVAKYACEKYIEYAHRSQGLQYVIVRQTNTYGRTNNNFFVTEQIITQMLQGDICKLGYKDPYRNFLYISDLLDAWQHVIENFDCISNKIFTLGPSNAIRIEDYAAMIAKKINWHGMIQWDTKPARLGEIYLLNSSEHDLCNATGWRPKVDLDQGLDYTIHIWQKNYAI